MKMKNDKEKNNLYFQDISSNENTLTNKIFKYFYSLFQEKKEFKSFFKYIQLFIETIQFISYAFSSIHYNSWKLDNKTIRIISNIISTFRISPFIHFLNYTIYKVILYLLIIFIFILSLILILNILFINTTSRFYQCSSTIIRSLIDIIAIIFYIPITEIILLPIRCLDGKVYGFEEGETCWERIHYLNVILGLFGTILLFFWCIFMLNFSFYPFQNTLSTIRINSKNDIINMVMKIIIVLQFLLISNEYISLVILLLVSITLFFSCYNESTYNNDHLEIAINMKNLLIIWTFFILLISKIFINLLDNGFIYLLISGYPIIIYLSIIIHKEKEFRNIKPIRNNVTIQDYIKNAKINMKLINSFFERNNNIRNGKENEEQRNTIILRGNIKFHNKMCSNKECPLNKFLNNEGNFNVQKQCLLNYMNIYFNKGLKLYPNNIYLLLLYIYFNYTKRFNLNSVRANLLQLKKIECSINDKYVIYCMEQNIKNLKNSGYDFNKENGQDNDSQMDLSEQKYQKLKNLIENSIKLYGEFWGIFTTNISSKINTSKLYILGEKLNIYLNEMNYLWDNELKNKKINNEYQSIVQLYSKFLLEILWDQKKSKEVYKKLNDENLNFHQNDNKKSKDEGGIGNLYELVDNQDFLLFCNSDEKGNCKIIQISASFSHFLGYQKMDIISKPLDKIFPNILIEEYIKFLGECINLLNNGQNNQNELAYNENDSNKNTKLIVVKNRMGYIFPLFASFRLLDDNDYSDSILVKIKMENKELKSEYAYFILTNPDFTIENISSSAINLGLSLDLLKKYVVKMDILVRDNNNKPLNLYERYNEYLEESKVVTWIFPDIIYPKDNIQQNKEEEIEELIEKSIKKEYNMQIKIINFNDNDNIAFFFKFTEINLKKNNNNNKFNNNDLYIPNSTKNIIIFYLENLNYVRTVVVDKKSGLRNLKNEEKEKEKIIEDQNIKLDLKTNKKRRKSFQLNEEDSESSEKNKKNILTKEKILELQVFNFIEIRNFIFSLPLYGSDVGLERFRPNGDKYSASKITESLIKIQISNFCKRMEEKFRFEQITKKKKSKSIYQNVNQIESPKSANTDNYLFSTNSNSSTNPMLSQSSKNIQGEYINKGISSDSSTALANIFKSNSIQYIKILINFTFLLTLILVLTEFLITYNNINRLSRKIHYLQNGYIILTNMLYTKHYVTEGVLGNVLKTNYFRVAYINTLDNFLNIITKELSSNREQFTEIYDSFTSNDLCKEYVDFMEITQIKIYTLTVSIPENITLLFNSAMTRISSSINDLVNDPSLMVMSNRDTYELIHNIINEYYINWVKVISILLNDSIKSTKLNMYQLFILLGYLLISIFILISLLKLLSKFSIDREKPINLFLTLKKVVFENLKNSAENFSNKLLNKFFGNEDNEEESQQDYQANIQPNDINIVKFKAANEYNTSIRKAFDFMIIIIIIMIFIILNLIYFVFKYFDYTKRMNNIYQFISLFDKTNIAQSDSILSVEIFKSYFFNKSIPILNNDDTKKIFFESLINITNKFEDSVIFTSKTKSFLSGEYLQKYESYYFGDYSELLDEEFLSNYGGIMKNSFKYGLNPVESRIFELIKYISIIYCNSRKEIDDDKFSSISYIIEEEGDKIFELNFLSETIIRKWFDGVLKLMMDSFDEYQKNNNLTYIIFFVSLIVIIILYYFIIWRIFEEKLNSLLKGSADLINLIPQEIKNIIIEKLNE